MIRTERLVLRPWRDSDRPVFAAHSADPEVMRHFPKTLTRAEADAYVDKTNRELAEYGFCKWAVEMPGVAPFIGIVGIGPIVWEAEFTPAVELAWRLGRDYWGKGLATEAARAAMRDGFERAGLAEIVAVTSLGNTRSIAVMQRLGMVRDREFDHPRLEEGHRLRRHVLYRADRKAWLAAAANAQAALSS